MLDSLGSTLTHETIEGFFKSSGKSIEDDLTMEEVILHLEQEVNKPKKDRAKVAPVQTDVESQTPDEIPSMAPQPAGSGLGMTGPQGNISAGPDPAELTEHILESTAQRDETNSGNQHELAVPNIQLRKTSADGQLGSVTPTFEDDSDGDADSAASDEPSDQLDPESDYRERERVIDIRTCPLCHRSRLKKKSEQDIITHLAICASADWSRVDRIVSANYVTSSQAQRKFLTRMMNKVAIGAYSLGANSANILVQDRMTGQLQEEKMAVSVKMQLLCWTRQTG